MTKIKKQTLRVRNAKLSDIPEIIDLSRRVYSKDFCYSESTLRGQITNFPEGQFVVDVEGDIVGYCATFIIDGEIALTPHTWKEITGGGFASRHDEDGDYLYGMEVCVDPAHRGNRIGQRLYNARKKLCEEYELKGIVFGGRMPGYQKKQKQYATPKDYVEAVRTKQARDLVIGFQLRNGFEILGVLPKYLPADAESVGNGVHMIWRNPSVPSEKIRKAHRNRRLSNSVRVACIQFQARKFKDIDDFEQAVEYFVDVAADYHSDFVCFPEMLTLCLLSTHEKKLNPEESVRYVTKYTERFVEFMRNLAISYNINIIGGSHPTKTEEGDVKNIAYVFLRGGTVHTQSKIHPTPSEKHWWNIKGGSHVEAIQTDCGPIGVLICYDAEFPELTRHLADQGALILFVPFCTDERQGYNRVRYCAQARAIENQMYVATAGIVGNIPSVENMDIHYAESSILTPCDFAFARDGIAATTPANVETIIMADLSLEDLIINRNEGTVRNFKDRRFDLYRVEWTGPGIKKEI